MPQKQYNIWCKVQSERVKCTDPQKLDQNLTIRRSVHGVDALFCVEYVRVTRAVYLYHKPRAMQQRTHQRQSLYQGDPSWYRQYQVEE